MVTPKPKNTIKLMTIGSNTPIITLELNLAKKYTGGVYILFMSSLLNTGT